MLYRPDALPGHTTVS